MKRQVMTVEQQAEKLIDEAYQYAPSSGGTKEVISIRIAIWCAERSHSITANGKILAKGGICSTTVDRCTNDG